MRIRIAAVAVAALSTAALAGCSSSGADTAPKPSPAISSPETGHEDLSVTTAPRPTPRTLFDSQKMADDIQDSPQGKALGLHGVACPANQQVKASRTFQCTAGDTKIKITVTSDDGHYKWLPLPASPERRTELAAGAKASIDGGVGKGGGYAQVVAVKTVPDSPGLLDEPKEMIYAAEVRVCVGPPKTPTYLTDQVWSIQFTNDTFGDSSSVWEMPHGEAMYPSQFNVPAPGGCAQGWIQELAQKGLTMATIHYSPTGPDGNASPDAASWNVR